MEAGYSIPQPRVLGKNEKKDTIHIWLLFIAWPFLSFLYALLNFRSRPLRKFIFLFFIYYGFVFIVKNPEVDANRYIEQFQEWTSRGVEEYMTQVSSIYSEGSEQNITDPFIITVDFLLSRFTSNEQFLMATFAFFFGFVYLKAIGSIFDYKKEWNNTLLIPYYFYFASILSIINISTFRFAFASWIFFYGAYQVVIVRGLESKASMMRYIFIAFSAILVHFSFLIPCLILLIYLTAGNLGVLYYPLVLSSFIFRQDFSSLIDLQDVDIPTSISKKSQAYLSEGYKSLYKENREGLKWFIRYPFNFIFAGIALLVMRIRHNLSNLQPGTINLFYFCLLYFAFANFVGETNQLIRFQFLTSLFVIALIIRVYKDLSITSFKWIDGLALGVFVLHSLLIFRIGSETINILLFSPSFLAFLDDSTTLYDIIF